MKKFLLLIILIFSFSVVRAQYILIPMDEGQHQHLKAYGVAYKVLTFDMEVDWLLNYRGGSFAFQLNPVFEKECKLRGVKYEVLSSAQYNRILAEIADPEVNADVIKLEKAPKIAVYAPKSTKPWDDAVTLVLTYAEIPYDIIYDDEVLQNKLPLYDWLHLHHEDFTGQYGKFWASFQHAAWYQQDVRELTEIANRWGFKKVTQLKLAVVKKIRDYVMGGGFMFAMCSATDTYDIALAADGVDIVTAPFDGDPADPQAQSKLDFSKTFAFKDFQLIFDPYVYEHSSIDNTMHRTGMNENNDFFTLFEYSAKWDPIPSMLNQNHTRVIKGFMGQLTAFRKEFIKSEVLILGENKAQNEARYIHGTYGKGMWTFYGGHDPEDYQHMVGDPPTDLSLFPNSPGYRLILNNVLFPAAKKQKRKT
jgi:hypothetical protein